MGEAPSRNGRFGVRGGGGLIPEAGYAINSEKPDAVAVAIGRFLAELS